MDVTPMLNQIFSAAWYLVPIFIVLILIKMPWFKGVVGEFQVNCLLNVFLSKEKYRLIKNVTLPTAEGTTQIDHIVVSKYGVFVIETKNMKGWIFGSANQKQWTQKIFKHTNKFQNPIHQNYKHIKTLERCLGLNQEFLHSVIVFIGDSTFKTKVPEYVTHAKGCVNYIKSKKVEFLTQSQIEEIIVNIESGRLQRSMRTNRDHVVHVKEIVRAKDFKQQEKLKCKGNENKSDGFCPKCGADMIIRESKKGKNAGNKFFGCSLFPKCRGVKQIT